MKGKQTRTDQTNHFREAPQAQPAGVNANVKFILDNV